MKKIINIIYKNGNEAYMNSKINDVTYYDLQTKGKIARKNLLKILRHNYIDYKQVKEIIFEDNTRVEMYSVKEAY